MTSKHLEINITGGQGVNEKGFDDNNRCIIEVDDRYYRPTEVEELLGDAKSSTRIKLASKYEVNDLIKQMVEHDLKIAKRSFN